MDHRNQLVRKDAMNLDPSLDEVIRTINRLPPFPVVVREALVLLEQECPSLPRLATTLERDPILAGRLLRVANSSFYGMPGKIVAMKDACRVLGFQVLRNTLNACGALAAFPVNASLVVDRMALWEKGAATAAVARIVATAKKLNGDAAFTAGLFHNIGCLVLESMNNEKYRRLREQFAGNVDELYGAELTAFGGDQRQVGATLLKTWKLPELVVDAVAYSAYPEKSVNNDLAYVVYLAERIAEGLLRHENAETVTVALPVNAMSTLDLTADELTQWWDGLSSAATESQSMLLES